MMCSSIVDSTADTLEELSVSSPSPVKAYHHHHLDHPQPQQRCSLDHHLAQHDTPQDQPQGHGMDSKLSSSPTTTATTTSNTLTTTSTTLTDEEITTTTNVVMDTAPVATTHVVVVPINSRRVHFNDELQVRSTLSLQEFNKEEHFSCWYRRKEYSLIRKRIQQTMSLVQSGVLPLPRGDQDLEDHPTNNNDNGNNSDSDDSDDSANYHRKRKGNSYKDNEFCLRGLEARTPRGCKRRRDNKFVGMCVVLDGQGHSPPEYLADLYSLANRHCRNEAYATALQDQAEALRIYGDDDDFQKQKLKSFLQKTRVLRRQVLEEGRRMRMEAAHATQTMSPVPLAPQPQQQQQQQQ